MAYDLTERFLPPKPPIKLLDPGAYQHPGGPAIKRNHCGFNSTSTRKTQNINKVWADAIYDSSCDIVRHRIPNCTSLKSKTKRFAYTTSIEEEVKDILCRCGIDETCSCGVDQQEIPEGICQAKVKKNIFIGPPRPRKPLNYKTVQITPEYYDTRVFESTAYYHGCKFSKRTAKRFQYSTEVRPGPADYSLEKKLTDQELCMINERSYRRKISKQYRYIESVQRTNILLDFPAPDHYNINPPQKTELSYLGPKAERFPSSQYDTKPGPADHFLKRDFDLPEQPQNGTNMKIPESHIFGRAKRFKSLKSFSPGPADYDPKYKICNVVYCQTAPFNTSASRWKKDVIPEFEYDDDKNEEECCRCENVGETQCPKLSSMFKSTTVRMKPLLKDFHSPSPADFMPRKIVKRSSTLQYLAPFSTSEGRFRPWRNSIRVHGLLKTPGPGYYNAQKVRGRPAVFWGPTFQARRFPPPTFVTPAPNEYKVKGKVDEVLHTHNKNLKKNVKNKNKFEWVMPEEAVCLSLREKQAIILESAIRCLNVSNEKIEEKPFLCKSKDTCTNNRLLRCFLTNHRVPIL